MAVSDIRKYDSQPVLQELEKHTGALSSLSPEELTCVLIWLLDLLEEQWTWQFHIAKNGHMDEFATVCKHIIDCGAIIDRFDVCYNNKVLRNPCAIVWRSNEKQLVKLFLDAGASINPSGVRRRTPLHDLAFDFRADDFDDEAIKLLQRAGVDINARDDSGRTVLDIAANPFMRTYGSVDTIRRLQALGAKFNLWVETSAGLFDYNCSHSVQHSNKQ